MKYLILSILSSLLIDQAAAQEVQCITSSAEGKRLQVSTITTIVDAPIPLKNMMLYLDKNEILIQPEWKFQKIDGFGASFLEAGMICANSLAVKDKEALFESLFDSIKGSGFSVMKSPLAGTDFMAAGDWYTYNDVAGDVEMKNFSIARDLAPNGQITYIKEAQKYGQFKIQSPMDYPPDWMISDTTPHKQDIDSKYFDALALYYLRYLQAYEKQGVNITYLSMFNEPGIYTKISYNKIATLLANHVGPLFEKNKIKTKIQFCEANERINAWTFFPTVLNNPNAAKYVGGLAFHAYDYGKNFDKITQMNVNYPNLPIWMTEVCHAYICGTPKTLPLPVYDFSDGDYWGNQIVSDLESGVSAWIYWNMILDENGGPWLISEIHHNPKENVQHPVVIVDRKQKKVHYTGLYYYLTHFSKFVRPGCVRIGSHETIEGIRSIAFQNTDNEVVVQILNSTTERKEVKIRLGKKQVSMQVDPISINTLKWRLK